MYDVIIPLKSTNRLIIDNLRSISSFLEVKCIYIGDSGIDSLLRNEIESIAKVKIIDQSKFYSQGACIIDLIKHVDTKYFVYLHGDVTLPDDWFEKMRANLGNSKFAECGRVHKYNVEYSESILSREYPKARPLSGAQMGDTDFFIDATSCVDDDFLFRNEDLVFADLIQQRGGRYKIINQTYHVHQLGFNRVNENINSDTKVRLLSTPTAKDLQLFRNQVEGIVKYSSPSQAHLRENVIYSIAVLKSLGDSEFLSELIKKQNYKKWSFTIRLNSLFCFYFRLKKIYRVLRQTNRQIFED